MSSTLSPFSDMCVGRLMLPYFGLSLETFKMPRMRKRCSLIIYVPKVNVAGKLFLEWMVQANEVWQVFFTRIWWAFVTACGLLLHAAFYDF